MMEAASLLYILIAEPVVDGSYIGGSRDELVYLQDR